MLFAAVLVSRYTREVQIKNVFTRLLLLFLEQNKDLSFLVPAEIVTTCTSPTVNWV